MVEPAPVPPGDLAALGSKNFDIPALDPAAYTPPSGGILVLRDAGEIIGLAGFRRVDDATCELDPFKVSIYHRGRGIGGKLMRAVLNAAAAAGYGKITSHFMLWCPDYQQFYHRHGFAMTAESAERALP